MTICTDGLAMGTEPMPRQLPHLPALDGLRAIAVIFVVAYHLDLGWARGGFIGVDIFFVISGFLITRLLIDEQGASGRIAVIGFWIRRFRRLVPALVVMVGATLLATRWWGLPEQWDGVRRDGVASLAYVANWRFVFDRQSYFESAIGPSPLLHTWSLAVEEQWYLVWPIVMVGLLALAQRPRRGAAIATMTVVLAAVASAGLMAALYDPADASRVYFGTDTRAQQLLVGAALAWFTTWVPTLEDVPEHRVFRLASRISLVILGVIAVTVDDTSAWLYRGGFLAISVLAAVVVLGTATTHRSGAFNWLGGQPWGWIGRRSYGIYLWHWPVIIFVGPAMGLEMATIPLIAVQLTVMLLLAEMSFRLVEQPVRRSVAPASRTIAAWTLGASAVAAVGVVGLSAPTDRRLEQLGSVVLPVDDIVVASTTTPVESEQELPAPPTTSRAERTPGDMAAPPEEVPPVRRLVLLGDSAAYSLAEQFDRSIAPSWDVQAVVQTGCPLTPGVTLDAGSSTPNPRDPNCVDWREIWPAYVSALDPDIVVVMIGAWEVLDHLVDGRDIRFPSPEWDELIATTLVGAADAAATTGAPVVFFDVACMGGPRSNLGTTARSDPTRTAAVNRHLDDLAAAREDVTIERVSMVVCPTGVDGLEIDGTPVRYDGVHFTSVGASLVWPWVFEQLQRVR